MIPEDDLEFFAMIRKGWVILIMTFLSACSGGTQVRYTPNQLILKSDGQFISVKAKTLKSDFINLGRISINQKVLKLDTEDVVVYEDVFIGSDYQIKHSYDRALRLIFDALDVERIATISALGFYSIVLRDKTDLFVVVKTATKKRISMVYGRNRCLFETTINELDKQQFVQQKECQNIKTDPENAIQSKWQVKLVILDGLLEQVPRLRPR